VSSIDQIAGSSAQDYADSVAAFVEAQIPTVDVVAVMLNQRADANGNPYDVMDIGFTLPPYSDVFYCHPEATRSWRHHALHAISLKANKVLSIYAGYQVREDVIPLWYPLASDYANGEVPGTQPPPPVAF
jgi:hypothetical protein